MLTLAAELRGRYALLFACPPSPSGLPLLARARKMGLATLPLEVRGEQGEASERLGGWLRAQRVRVFHGHAGVAGEGHDGIRAARAAAVPSVVRTEHLPLLTTVFRTEDLPDLVHSPYHRADQRPDHRRLTEMVEGHRADHLRMIGMVDRLICVSAAARESFLRSGVPAHKLRVVRNGIRPQPAARGAAEVRERLGIPSRARIVLTVGRMLELKGYHCLLEAVPAVVEGEPKACFLWAGEGPLEGELRERARALGLDGWVCFAGRREDVSDLMSATDLFVLPSLVEGLPRWCSKPWRPGSPSWARACAGRARPSATASPDAWSRPAAWWRPATRPRWPPPSSSPCKIRNSRPVGAPPGGRWSNASSAPGAWPARQPRSTKNCCANPQRCDLRYCQGNAVMQ